MKPAASCGLQKLLPSQLPVCVLGLYLRLQSEACSCVMQEMCKQCGLAPSGRCYWQTSLLTGRWSHWIVASINLTWLSAESAEQAEQQAQAASDPEQVFQEGGMAQPSVQAKDKQQGATSRPMAPSALEDMIQPSPTDEGNSAERDIDVQVKLAACSGVPMSSGIESFCK